MKKVLPALLSVLAVGLLLAQDTPNFSGTWLFDKAKSDHVGGMMGSSNPPVSGGGQASGQTRQGGMILVQPDVILEIKHEGINLKIARKTNRDNLEEFKYTTNGAENRIPGGGTGSKEITSKSRWDGKKLVTESFPSNGSSGFKTKEVLALSEDGKVLSVEFTTMGTPRGDITRKQVFNKQ